MTPSPESYPLFPEAQPPLRTCKKCGVPQSLSNFRSAGPRAKVCLSCQAVTTKESINRRTFDVCPNCGQRKSKRSKQCESCRLKKLQEAREAPFKVCTKCGGDPQPISNFPKRSQKRGGISEWCRECCSKRAKAWHEKNRDTQLIKLKTMYQLNKPKHKLSGRKRRMANFGTTIDWYETTLAAQDYKCALCRSSKAGYPSGRFAIDHNHACCPDKTACDRCRRALLCANCNFSLGVLEKTEWVKIAYEYLARFPLSSRSLSS